MVVKYTKTRDVFYQKRDTYFIKMLKLAAEYSDTPINFVPVNMLSQVESRDVVNVATGVLDVHWLHTSENIESQLAPVRIPLFKGLIGLRLMLVRKDNIDLLKGVTTLAELQRFSLLQSNDWPDTPILKASGLHVESAIEFRSLFRMLQYRRAELFPRSITEIWRELKDQSELDIGVDPHIALYYPTAYYFFVAKDNTALQDALELGLNRAIANGSFDRLFQEYFTEAIQKAHLSQRNVITIKNPDLPPLTPLQRPELWFWQVERNKENPY